MESQSVQPSHVYCVDNRNINVFEPSPKESEFCEKSYYIGLDHIFQENISAHCLRAECEASENTTTTTSATKGSTEFLSTPTTATVSTEQVLLEEVPIAATTATLNSPNSIPFLCSCAHFKPNTIYDPHSIQEIRVNQLPTCEYYHHPHSSPQLSVGPTSQNNISYSSHQHHQHHHQHSHHHEHQSPVLVRESSSVERIKSVPDESLLQRCQTNLSAYLPFIIVTSILSLAVTLLISASIIYFQIPTGYSKSSFNNCERNNCSHHSICAKDLNGEEKCMCQEECPSEGNTVCGTDGVTYQNECYLQLNSCQKNANILIAYYDACDVCKNVHCKYGAVCEKGTCICPTQCPDSLEPVCSSNGLTYTNECLLRRSICENGTPITISYYGECQDNMSGSETSELIGGAGYIQTCDPNTCLYGGTCDYDKNGIPQCLCSYSCPSSDSEEDKVCGSDGRLYENECKLQEEACSRQQDIKPEERTMCEESKIIPCEGETPLPGTQFTCETVPDFANCPETFYCHKTLNFAKCCPQKASNAQNCNESEHGCCPDGQTPAPGPNSAGCPSLCNCNRLGSYGLTCDPNNGQCHCKPGVGGIQCDRCEAGYWGLHKISEGNTGCIPCSCNMNGSVRDDCEQMTGRCICKHGLQGMKCNVCPEDAVLGPDGCSDVSLTKLLTGNCAETECKFGAVCRNMSTYQVQCVCDIDCGFDQAKKRLVSSGAERICASDGQTYPSECGLRLYACRMQKNLTVLYRGECQHQQPGQQHTHHSHSHNQLLINESSNTGSTMLSLSASSSSSSSSSFFRLTTNPDAYSEYPSSTSQGSSTNTLSLTEPIVTSIVDSVTSGPLKRSTVFKTTVQDSESSEAAFDKQIHENETVLTEDTSSTRPTSSDTGSESISFNNNDFGNVTKKSQTSENTSPKSIKIPSFFGESFIEMPRLAAYTRLSIEMEFLTFSENGLLIYNGQTISGEGDFVSISIKGGYIEFRYNLGSGIVILRSTEKIVTREKVKLVAKRYLRDGILTVEGQDDVAGKAEGDLKNLDLAENLYIGSIVTNQSRIYDNIGIRKGFIGCLYSLRIGRNPINLTYPGSSDILRMVNVIDCSELPCFSSSATSCISGTG